MSPSSQPQLDSSPSATALLIAEAIVVRGADPATGPLIDPEMLRWSTHVVERIRGAAYLRLLQTWGIRLVTSIAERAIVPHLSLHYILRKKFIEEWTRRVIAEGVRQIVIIGAGFDSLALRLAPQFPEVLWIEADHPATQQEKVNLVRSATAVPPNLRFLPLDLATTPALGEMITTCGADSTAPVSWCAEGVMMYLDEAEVRKIFAGTRAAGSRWVFTFLFPGEDGKPHFRKRSLALHALLRRIEEPFRWGATADSVGAMLSENGWTLDQIVMPAELWQRYRPGKDASVADGDILATARV